MTLPSLDKTWEFDVNTLVSGDATEGATNAKADVRGVLLGIKEALIGFSTLPWTVISSSNGSTSGASDLWVDIDDIDFSTSDSSAHSWIVLQNTGIDTAFQLLINCVHGSATDRGDTIDMYVSRTGFTGGSTTARPTGTEEITLINDGQWGSGSINGGARAFRYHCMKSTDGEMTIIVIHHNGSPTGFWLFGRPKSPISAWTDDYIATALGQNNGGEAPDINDYYDNDTFLRTYRTERSAVTAEDAGMTRLYMSGRTFAGNHAVEAHTVANDVTGENPIYPIGLLSNDSAFRGYMGRIYDLHWGLAALAEGDTYPSGGTRTFVQFGDMVFPWDGSVVQTS